MTPRTFRLTVAYDGTAFHGWQRQPGVRTVQGELEGALAVVLASAEVTVAGAGRTDAGVHARGQVASFRHESHLPARAFPPLLNRSLPRDVRVTAASEEPEGFHARHSARARRYRYRLLAAPDVLAERYAWAPPVLPPFAALAESAQVLRGTHDCSAFQTVSRTPADPVCHVHVARWTEHPDGAEFEVVADHFLYRMVRNLVGTSLAAAARPEPGVHMRAVLESRDRRRRMGPAPPQGLSLEQVYYAGETWPEEAAST